MYFVSTIFPASFISHKTEKANRSPSSRNEHKFELSNSGTISILWKKISFIVYIKNVIRVVFICFLSHLAYLCGSTVPIFFKVNYYVPKEPALLNRSSNIFRPIHLLRGRGLREYEVADLRDLIIPADRYHV